MWENLALTINFPSVRRVYYISKGTQLYSFSLLHQIVLQTNINISCVEKKKNYSEFSKADFGFPCCAHAVDMSFPDSRSLVCLNGYLNSSYWGVQLMIV